MTLKKVIHSKKVELDTNRARSGRMRSRRSLTTAQKYSAECAALQYDTEEEEEVPQDQQGAQFGWFNDLRIFDPGSKTSS